MEFTRRRFIVLSALSVGSSLFPTGCAETASSPPPQTPSPDRGRFPPTELEWKQIVEEYFADAKPQDVRRVGDTYLQTFGADEQALVDDLSRVVHLVSDISELDEALTRLDRAVIEDFEAPQLTSVDGWQLAAAESQLTAHYALLDE